MDRSPQRPTESWAKYIKRIDWAVYQNVLEFLRLRLWIVYHTAPKVNAMRVTLEDDGPTVRANGQPGRIYKAAMISPSGFVAATGRGASNASALLALAAQVQAFEEECALSDKVIDLVLAEEAAVNALTAIITHFR